DHDVLMIDEALATGDRSFQKRSEARIRELRKEAGTVFLVSHNNKSIRDTCDRVLWLERGEVLMDGPTDEVIKAYEDFSRS
ncbi:ABC transporter ATP-binding protein, partial [Streptomyces inhibens]